MSQSPCHSRHSLTGLLRRKFRLPAGYTYTWSGEYEFEVRAKDRLKFILPVVFFVIFVLLGGMITSTIHVLILVPVFFVLMKERALRRGTLRKEATETIRIDLFHAALNNLGRVTNLAGMAAKSGPPLPEVVVRTLYEIKICP
jgi:hypothetical protein